MDAIDINVISVVCRWSIRDHFSFAPSASPTLRLCAHYPRGRDGVMSLSTINSDLTNLLLMMRTDDCDATGFVNFCRRKMQRRIATSPPCKQFYTVQWFHFVIFLPLNIFCRSVSNLSLLLFLVILIWACDCAAESKANAEAIKKIHVAMLERAAREAVYARMACDARASAEFNSRMGAERNREQSFVFHFT